MKQLYKLLPNIFLLIILFLLFANRAFSQTSDSDTTIYYLRYVKEGEAQNNSVLIGPIIDADPFKRATLVNSIRDADYFIVFLPPKQDGTRDIQEFYKNGKRKRIATLMAGAAIGPSYQGFVGDCVDYYANGRKSRIMHFNEGAPIGDEYLFYPSGAVYCYKKIIVPYGIYKKILYLDCYDNKGNMISQGGDGDWIEYDQGFKRIILKGPVKKGYWVGEWNGNTNGPDSIRFVYQLKDSKIIKATGYDKTGKAYPFEKEFTYATFQGGPQNFIQSVRNHLKTPHDNLGKRISIDTMHVSFVIEKDGKPSDINVLGDVGQNVQDAVTAAVSKCMDWTPTKYYGVPYRTKIVVPLSYNREIIDRLLIDQNDDSYNYTYHTSVYYKMQVFDLQLKKQDLP